jgi:hypothetical protein
MSGDSEKEELDLLRGLTDQAFENVKAEMKRLKLDRGKAAYRRPLDLLEEAYLAIRYPASAQGGASSALLTLRGCIERSIEELARRCPAQKQAQSRRDRVLALGLHCGRSGLSVAHFDSLAADDEVVNRDLSASGSQAAMERPDLVKQFARGAQFLRAFLSSVDETLLRP